MYGDHSFLYLDEGTEKSEHTQTAFELLNLAGIPYEHGFFRYDEDWGQRPLLSYPEKGFAGWYLSLGGIRRYCRVCLLKDSIKDRETTWWETALVPYPRPPVYPITVSCRDSEGEVVYEGPIYKCPHTFNTNIKRAISKGWHGKKDLHEVLNPDNNVNLFWSEKDYYFLYIWDLGEWNELKKQANPLLVWPKALSALFPDEIKKLDSGEKGDLWGRNQEKVITILDGGTIAALYDVYFIDWGRLYRVCVANTYWVGGV